MKPLLQAANESTESAVPQAAPAATSPALGQEGHDIANSAISFEEVVQRLPVMLAIFDASGRCLRWNRTLEEVLGYSARELKETNILDTVAAEYREIVQHKIQESLEKDSSVAEAVLVTKSGVRIPHLLTSTPMVVAGQPCVFGVAIDISRRKQAEEAQRASEVRVHEEHERAEKLIRQTEERYRRLVDNLPDVTWTSTMNADTVYVSPNVLAVLGYSSQEMCEQGDELWPGRIHPDDAVRVATAYKALFSDNQPFDEEYRIQRKDGAWIWVHDRALRTYEEDGTIYADGVFSDVTARKQAERALRQSEEQFREIAENIREVFFIFMPDPVRTAYLSPAYDQVWGKPRQEVYERPEAWLDSVHPHDRERACADFARCLQGVPVETDFRVVRPDDSTRSIHARSFPIHEPGGKLIRAVGIAEDVTARQRMLEAVESAKQAAEAASRAKSEFLANMSHEIRTPLNGILGMTDLALETELSEEQRDYLLAAKSSGEVLLHLLNDILDFSKIEAGKLDVEVIEFNLHDCVGETVKAWALRAHEKGLELVYQVEPEVPQQLLGDPVRLKQVLANLIGNAIKFTRQGEVVVRVHTERAAHGAQLIITVSDTGIGIPEQKQEAIFQAFTQVDASTTRTYGGTGLGLAISARLVELMHGQISVESEEGKGSRFQFRIPLLVPQRSMAAGSAARPDLLAGVRILVVDDNQTNREILLHTTRDLGMLPKGAESGEAALREMDSALQKTAPYRVVLIDVRMPGMDGFALAERLQQDRRMAGTVIMMLTSSGQRGDAARSRQLGIAAYLEKPIRKQELMQALLTVLGQPVTVERPLVTRHTLRESRIGLRILVAEDNPVNQMLIMRLLEKQGHKPELVRNGQEAAVLAATGQFDLVFMDLQMPEMDGFAATARIREREKSSGAHLPIFAMTAHAMKGDRECCLAAGMDGYLAKPVNFSDIQRVLAEVQAKQQEGKQPWDKHQALAQLGGDETLLRETVQLFLQEYPKLVKNLEQALDENDAESLSRTAHRLKGSVGCLSTGEAFLAIARLEEVAQQGNWVHASQLTNDVARALVRLREALENSCGVAHEANP